MKSLNIAGRLAVACMAVGTAVALSGGAAHASATPSDPSASGGMGLCDAHGQQITSGSVYAKPFVFRAAGTQQAPQPFNSNGRKATLYAFQPRPDTGASEWSGTPLSAATPYTNAAVPMAQFDRRDFALSDYLNQYPPQVSGTVELRLLYSDVDTGFSPSYAAMFIQIHGTTWHSTGSTRVDCSAGRATSPEVRMPRYDKAGLQPPQLLSVQAAQAVGAPTTRAANLAARDAALGKPLSASSSASGHPGSQRPTTGDQPASSPAAAAATGSRASGGFHAGLVIGLVIAVGLIVAGGMYAMRRRASAAD